MDKKMGKEMNARIDIWNFSGLFRYLQSLSPGLVAGSLD